MIKILPADKYFSLCVRERSDNTCERCGKVYSGGHGLQCCHYESRRNYSVRFDPLNAFSLCYGCHNLLDGSPLQFTKFYVDKRGQDKMEILVELSCDIMRGKENKHNLKEIETHYREEYESMLLKRSYGLTGYLPFVGWN
jgi:uncharacterized CHY-type Zn-finger protein